MKNTNVIMTNELAEKELNAVCAGGGTVKGRTTPTEEELREERLLRELNREFLV